MCIYIYIHMYLYLYFYILDSGGRAAPQFVGRAGDGPAGQPGDMHF